MYLSTYRVQIKAPSREYIYVMCLELCNVMYECDLCLSVRKNLKKFYVLSFVSPCFFYIFFDPTNGIRAWRGVRRDEFVACFGSSNRGLWRLHVYVGAPLAVTEAGG